MVPTKKAPRLAYTTDLGAAYQGDSRVLARSRKVRPQSVDLLFTSPPFALTRQKDYGNKRHTNKRFSEYLTWFKTFIPGWKRILSPAGSIVIDVGGAFLPGAPRRSTYHFELAVMLSKHFDVCQEFYWYNPAKLPGPAQWTNVERVRVKDSVNLLIWLARDAGKTNANNRRVLRRYSDSMQALLRNGYQIRRRPSNHDISQKFLADNSGSIPSNLLGFASDSCCPACLEGSSYESGFDNILAISNTSSTDPYLRACREHRLKPHNARFPIGLPAFFIEFLTKEGHLVMDPFAGSNTTGAAAEELGRRWVSCELDADGQFANTYVRSSAFRFPHAKLEVDFSELPEPNWLSPGTRVRPVADPAYGDLWAAHPEP